jgi:hypothetical protein
MLKLEETELADPEYPAYPGYSGKEQTEKY